MPSTEQGIAVQRLRNVVLTQLANVTGQGRLIVAFSGGKDSCVLLDVLAQARNELNQTILAVHIDHGLQSESSTWATWCGATAKNLDVEFATAKAAETPPPGTSLEAWARDQRYKLLAHIVAKGDVLLTAHHRDDSAETLLLKLLRGAGPHGLASIASSQIFGRATLLRPFLNIASSEIHDYAMERELRWIEDPSNADTRFDRNFLRHEVMPIIRQRWPAASVKIAQAASYQRDAAAILDELADSVLVGATPNGPSQINIRPLIKLDPKLLPWVLRRWIDSAGFPLPDTVHLVQIRRALSAGSDRLPIVQWKKTVLRRYRDELFLSSAASIDTQVSDLRWKVTQPLNLPHGTLRMRRVFGSGVAISYVENDTVDVRFRRGGERCCPVSRAHSQTLRRLFQEWGVPPWERFRVPLIYVGGHLVAVGDLCVCKPFGAQSDEPGFAVEWIANTGDGGY